MGNPLKTAMSKMVKSALPTSPLDLIASAFSNGNPQQALMNMLAQRNPVGYQKVKEMMESGQNPNEVISSLMSNMSPQQKQQVENLINGFSKMR